MVKKIFEVFTDKLLELIITFCLAALCYKLSPFVPSLSEESITFFVVIFFVMGSLVFMFMGKYRLAKKYAFVFESLDINVNYKGDSVIIDDYYKIKTLRLRQKKMFTRHDWFPNEAAHFSIGPKGYKLKRTSTIGPTSEYFILFPKAISFWNKPIKFHTKLNGQNKSRLFENFYWYTMICPVDKLIIDIQIPKNMCLPTATLKIFKTHENEDSAEFISIDYRNGFRTEIPNPKVGFNYKLEWNWAGEEKKHIERMRQGE